MLAKVLADREQDQARAAAAEAKSAAIAAGLVGMQTILEAVQERFSSQFASLDVRLSRSEDFLSDMQASMRELLKLAKKADDATSGKVLPEEAN